MSEERRAAPVPRPDPNASALGPRSPSASDEHPTPPDTDPTPIDGPVDSSPPDALGLGGADDRLAAVARAGLSRDGGSARRRGRMLRIPDDEIARPKTPAVSEPTPSPSPPVSRTAESSVILMPMRIITIGPAEPLLAPEPKAEPTPREAPDDGVLSAKELEPASADARPPTSWPSGSDDLIPIESEPSEPAEPAPVSVEPGAVESAEESDEEGDRPTPPPIAAPPVHAPLPPEPEDEDIALDDDIPTPLAPAIERSHPGGRSSDPGAELSVDDLLSVDAAPAPRKAPVALPPMRPRLPSQPPVPAPKPPAPPKSPLVIVPPHVGTMAPQPADAGTRRKGRLWWEDLFNDDYLRTCERLSDEQIASEVAFIEDRLGVERGGAVLDLACGTGRHAIELARRGYEVVGFDLSLAMLARAGEEAQDRDAKLNFVQGDMREMVFEEQFDGVYCWNTSFGYFEEDKNAQVIDRVHRALKAGGLLLLDVINRDFLIRQSPSLAWFEGDGCVCMDEMNVDFITSRMKVKRTIMLDDGRSREIEYSMRVYSLHELGKILHEHRFKVCEVSGRMGTPGVFFGNESPRVIILAEKR
jgi:SAM-dependent methyltransferase